jgi:pyruvate formate lyase activating enzyme
MVVKQAGRYRCPSIAYTYTEPIIFYEYMYDTAVVARKNGIRSVVVTGGHIKPEPLQALTKVVDAIKIDLKAFDQDFYTNYVHGDLQPVLDAIKIVWQSKVWLELVYLVIPTLNDDPLKIQRMCSWIAKNISPDVPLHFSRFQPMYLLKNLPPTPVSTLERARDVALKEGIKFSYIGNVYGHEGENTFCPQCQKIIIERLGYQIQKIELKGGNCKFCNTPIPGIWA